MGEDPARAAKGSSPINFAALKLDGLTSTLDYALAYAAVGMAVFPATPRKTPLTEHGYLDATTDVAIIRDWWSRYPAADIAWALPFEIVVLDLDEKHGDHGLRDFAELEGRAADDTDTPQATSPSGGRHLIFAAVGKRFKNNAKVIPGRGIDVRWHGGYVVLPSLGNGRQWTKSIATTPLADVPDWVPEREDDGTPQGTARAYTGPSDFESFVIAKAAAEIRSAPNREQEWTLNRWCYSIGGFVAGGWVEEGPAEAALIEAACAMRSYGRPWRRAALEKKVRHTIADGKRDPLDPLEEILEIGDQEQRAADFEATNPFAETPEIDPGEDGKAEDRSQGDDTVDVAEGELAKYVAMLRKAHGQSYRNATARNAGVRLARFIKAGRLNAERVLTEIDAALRSWGDTP
jgi:hypothetical protein